MRFNPLVSCICPTYGRATSDPDILAECVYWFTQRNYANAELLIVNDAPNQRLTCKVPGVRCINLNYRIPTLGEKYNVCCSFAKGEIVLPWEDDDISLPNRIPETVRMLKDYDYWNPGAAYFQNGRDGFLEYCNPSNVFHNTSGFKWKLWERHRYSYNLSGPQDMEYNLRLSAVANCNPTKLKPGVDPLLYVYRWQHCKTKNLSGFPNPADFYKVQSCPDADIEIVPKIGRYYLYEATNLDERSKNAAIRQRESLFKQT